MLAAVLIALAPPSAGQAFDEYAVKAAFLLNFTRYTDWPAAAFSNETAPLVLCIIGEDRFGPALESVNGKSVKGHPIQVDIKASATTVHHCHVAFISDSERSSLERWLQTVEKASVLTVSDIDRFARKGGVIGLLVEGGRVRFEVNLKAAERAQLKLSSNLLKLASIVRE
jgi:uncharacterized protein DUF4154